MGDGIDILKDTLKVLNGGSIDPDLVRSLTSNGSLSIELMGEILIKIQELVNSGGGGGVPTNLTLSNFRSGVVVPQIRNNTEATNNNIATELGIRNAIDQAILGTFKIQGNKDTEAEILALTGSEDYEAWICLEDGKLYYWLTNQWLSVKLVDINSFINNTNGIMVVSIMPSPTVNNKDYTYFYIGDTAGDFKTKTFYKCVEVLPSTTPKTYHYEEYVVASDVFIDTDDLASITNPTKQVIYRLRTITYKHNGDDVRNVIFYKALGAVVTNTGVSITLGDEIAYEDIVSEDITEWISFGYIKVGTYSDSDFVQYENDNGIFFDVKTTITEQIQYTLYHNPTEAETGYINISIEEPAIDNVELTENTTRQDIKLIGEADLIKDSEFVNPKPNGIDIVLNTGTSDNPNIINDDPAYQYANNKTSSNNYINTRLETIERKADAKTLTKFVDALPANPDINTEYYVETSTPNVYERYFVDSLGTVKEIGNTEMDVSTLATKVELNLKEDLSNKTTTLNDSSTNTQYPSAKAVVDYVKEHGSEIVETVLWQSPNGINGTSFYSRPTNITLTDNIKDYHLFKFTISRDDSKINSYYLTLKDIQLYAGSSYRFMPSLSYDSELSYLEVDIPVTTDTNIFHINNSNKCNLVNITGYKSIPMLNTYSREIRELIMNTPVGTSSETSGNITLTKGMSNYDYLDIYYQCADFTSINSNKRIRVSDLIEYYNNSSLKFRLETSDLDSNRKYISIYRSSDTVIHYDSYNLKMMKIYGIKAEPVVQGSPAYKQLYYNANGVSSGNITLNDAISKFKYIEILGKRGTYLFSSKANSTAFINSNNLILNTANYSTPNFVYIHYVSDTSVSVSNSSTENALTEVIGWY